MMRPDDETTTLQNPELAALASAANVADLAAADPDAPGAPGAVQVAPEPSQADQLGSILFMIGQAGAMRFPTLANVYTEEKCKAHGAAIAPALEKLGWTLNAGESMIFLTAAGSAIMLLVETRNTVLQELKAEQSAKQLQQASKPATPDSIAAANSQVAGQAPEAPVHPQMALYRNGNQ
ncbi:hypothetical protein [Herbaspirillum huttiense]|uniref:hypothetical protein n=1 Tax=Herbaspirillum huttiense TaxID=863372 RepID=UPI0031DB5BE5